MSMKIAGLDALMDKLDKDAYKLQFERGMNKAVLRVERSAKQKAPKGGEEGGSLAQSIVGVVESDGNTITGKVYSPLEYAPYVEYGTGKFAEKGGTSGYWIYVRHSFSGGVRSTKRYSLEEAKRIVAMMREDGLDAVYTCGSPAQPYMRPALNENRQKIIDDLGEAIRFD